MHSRLEPATVGPLSVAIGYLDGDGDLDLDLAVANASNNSVSILPNQTDVSPRRTRSPSHRSRNVTARVNWLFDGGASIIKAWPSEARLSLN